MNIKSIIVFGVVLFAASQLFAQSSIDVLQKSNASYLEGMEKQGYEFRSQIVTEFNAENAEQNVNICLKEGFTYQLVAMGDADVTVLGVEVKSFKKLGSSNLESEKPADNQEYLTFVPEKSGKYKISLNVKDFSSAGKGFVSFMVLRK